MRNKIVANLISLLGDNDGRICFDNEDEESLDDSPNLFYGDFSLYGMSLVKGRGVCDRVLFDVSEGVLGDSSLDTSTLLSILLYTIDYLRKKEVND